MNNKILSAILIAWIAATGFTGLSYADTETIDDWVKTIKESRQFSWDDSERKGSRWEWKKWSEKWHFKMNNLTDEEKISLETMSDEDKKEFFEAKKTEQQAAKVEQKAQRDSREAVIDSLLAWERLTTEQEVLRTEIINEREERKVKQVERESKMEEVKIILDKKHAGEDLTDEEQTILDEMKDSKKGGKKGWNKWGDRGERGNK